MGQSGREVEDADVDDLRVEDLLDLVADDVVDRLQLELAGNRLLDAVDQRQLGVALARLVHQAGVFERDAEAPRQRVEQLPVGLAERMLPIDVLERDHARRPAFGDERHVQHRLRHLAREQRVAVLLRRADEVLVDQQRLPRLDHVLPKAHQRNRLVREAHAALDRVREARSAPTRARRCRCRRPARRRPPGSCRRRRRRSPAARARRRAPPGRC